METKKFISSDDFIGAARELVAEYTNQHTDSTDGVSIKSQDAYIVWYSKSLQNHKALLSTPLPDGMYYEVTYNGDDGEIYFDAYKKFENRRIKCDFDEPEPENDGESTEGEISSETEGE